MDQKRTPDQGQTQGGSNPNANKPPAEGRRDIRGDEGDRNIRENVRNEDLGDRDIGGSESNLGGGRVNDETNRGLRGYESNRGEGISNKGIDRELDEQSELPSRGSDKSEG
jgi:hypothetical protein